MSHPQEGIPESTLDLLARSFYRQSSDYGFQQVDYIRFVNKILDRAMGHQETFPFKAKGPVDGPKREKGMHSPSLPVTGERVKIRAIDRNKDRPLFEEWLADEFGKHFLLSLSTARTPTIDQFLENEYHIIGVILSSEDDKPIGSVAYLNYDVNQCKAELRKLIGVPALRGKGLGKEATALWIQYGIDALDLHKIFLNTLDTNLRNIKLNEELGFHVEGILRNEVFIDGKYHDVLRMGISFES